MDAMRFAEETDDAIPLSAVSEDGFAEWQDSLDAAAKAWVEASGFAGKAGTQILFADPSGALSAVAVGIGKPDAARAERFPLAAVRGKLPARTYRLTGWIDDKHLEAAALGWLLAGYRFGRYKSAPPPKAHLVAPAGIDAARLEAIAAGEALTRDLINTPASDMGPEALAKAALALADAHGAEAQVIDGDALLDANFPMIHAVGRAASQAPRLIDFRWGSAGPKLTLVGKGVCFDTGGLNLKPGASMGLMKKDMGGAATVLGLASMIMTLGMPVQLRVLIPAVENSVSSASFRPGDILTSRKGLTVEINNTDAEGRLVLADALALADQEKPDLIVSMATLTGAARVAVGADLAPFYVDDDAVAEALARGSSEVRDPVWRMPFWDAYESQIEPGIADLDNAPKGGFGGSITAALFLRRFVTDTPRYLHFDIYGWQPNPAPARPKGGVGQGARALLAALPEILAL